MASIQSGVDIEIGAVILGIIAVLGLWSWLAYHTIAYHCSPCWWMQLLPAVIILAVLNDPHRC